MAVLRVDEVRALPARRILLDGEALAVGVDGRPEPCQVGVRRYREDERAEEADTVEAVRRLFERGRGRGR